MSRHHLIRWSNRFGRALLAVSILCMVGISLGRVASAQEIVAIAGR